MMRYLTILLLLFTASCASLSGPSGMAAGDSQRGEALFKSGTNGAPPCMTCHALAPGQFTLGPVMMGIRERAGSRVEQLSVESYLRQSILEPGLYVVPGYRNLMYPEYQSLFSEQNIADLIAFLITL